jgi:transposase
VAYPEPEAGLQDDRSFRHQNGSAVRKVCRQFIEMCRRLDLFAHALVAIDGSKFKAVNSRDKNFTEAKLKRRIAMIKESIRNYLRAMDTADRSEPELAQMKKGRLQEKIAALKRQMQELKAVEARLREHPDEQVSLTDPDARSMKTRGTGIVGYNVQTAVDQKTHMIVAHEVVNEGDRDQLTPMTEKAQEATGIKNLTVVADRGYYEGEQILDCEQTGASTWAAAFSSSLHMIIRAKSCPQNFCHASRILTPLLSSRSSAACPAAWLPEEISSSSTSPSLEA